MLVDKDRLHIAIQKSGRLADLSRDLLRDAGLRIQNGRNSLTARVDNFPIDLMFVRDDDIPTFVADGVCEFGMVGRNVLEEFALDQPEARFEVLADLGFGRCALRIAAPERTDYRGPESLAGSRIATSYPRLVRRFLDDERDRGDGGEDERRGGVGPPARHRPLHLRPGLDRRDAGGERAACPPTSCWRARRCWSAR